MRQPRLHTVLIGAGATPELISDYLGGGGLQYSAAIGGAIDEHVVIRDDQSTAGPVTFDLQMGENLSFSDGCIVWGTATPST